MHDEFSKIKKNICCILIEAADIDNIVPRQAVFNELIVV